MLNSALVLVARTDAEAATMIDSNIAAELHRFTEKDSSGLQTGDIEYQHEICCDLIPQQAPRDCFVLSTHGQLF